MFTIGNWQAEIADSSLVGWFTVGSYYLCAVLNLACFLKARAETDRATARFRLAITGVIIALGLSKQFNLPGAVTEIGRMLVNLVDGYEWRRWAQAFVLLTGGFAFMCILRWSARHRAFYRAWRSCAPEMICLCYLGGLVILRAISFHYIGAVLATEVFGIRMNWIVELAGIYTLAFLLLMNTMANRSSPLT